MATLIKPDGEQLSVTPKNEIFTLEEMYNLLECSCVQIIQLHDGRIMWIDENGKLKRHFINPMATFINPKATVLLEMAGGEPGDHIVGSALITDLNEID